ncbi:MAG: EamA family transporter [Chloroflexi bacterium]|nr:EamA family transporter [Chloroflexota bacterium]
MSSLLTARVSARFARQSGIFIIVLAAILWGTVGVTTRGVFTLSETTALTVAFLRLAVALPALALTAAAVLGRRALVARPRHLLLMAGAGTMLALYQLCYFGAIQRVGVAAATLVTLCAAPVIVALVSTTFLGERATRQLLLAAGLAIGGTILLVSPGETSAGNGETTLGVLLALGSATGYALIAMVSRTLARVAHPLTSMTVSFAFGAAALLPALLLEGLHLSFTPAAWGLLVYLGVVPSALAYVLFTIGMRTTVATVASLVTLIEPLTAALLAWLIFGEQLGPLALVGGMLLLGAVLLLTRE